MKIAVFTSNQRRHFALIRDLAAIADEVIAVQECDTIFPGVVADLYRQTEVMARYFALVRAAEATVFDPISILPANVRVLALRSGDINQLPLSTFEHSLTADVTVVFGASYLKGALCDALIERRAVNIHMGVSPYYRGSSCNFWAMYDKRLDMVGATIHLLGKGLDSGRMLFHAFPEPQASDPFEYGMLCVHAAHAALAEAIRSGRLRDLRAIEQDRSRQIRYTRTSEFTDAVAAEYLNRLPSAEEMDRACRQRDLTLFHQPAIVRAMRH